MHIYIAIAIHALILHDTYIASTDKDTCRELDDTQEKSTSSDNNGNSYYISYYSYIAS